MKNLDCERFWDAACNIMGFEDLPIFYGMANGSLGMDIMTQSDRLIIIFGTKKERII
jgi:hypothetical protein